MIPRCLNDLEFTLQKKQVIILTEAICWRTKFCRQKPLNHPPTLPINFLRAAAQPTPQPRTCRNLAQTCSYRPRVRKDPSWARRPKVLAMNNSKQWFTAEACFGSARSLMLVTLTAEVSGKSNDGAPDHLIDHKTLHFPLWPIIRWTWWLSVRKFHEGTSLTKLRFVLISFSSLATVGLDWSILANKMLCLRLPCFFAALTDGGCKTPKSRAVKLSTWGLVLGAIAWWAKPSARCTGGSA